MKRNLMFLLAVVLVSITILSCEKEKMVVTPVNDDRSFVEEFDTVGNLANEGWVFRNNSKPGGFIQWEQATGSFPAFSYYWDGLEYASCSFATGSDVSNLSVWMITKPILLKNGDKVSFYTRTVSTVTFPDRMQFRANLMDANPGVGNDSSSVGNFTKLIFDINPNQLASGAGSYPLTWTRYEYTVTGLPLSIPTNHRFAFRYYVRLGGTLGFNAEYVGVDKFEVNAVP